MAGTSEQASAPPGLQAGDRIGGKYVVDGVLGAGGMGMVLVAQHLVLGSRVAIKVLLPAAGAIPGATERFVREARAAAAMHGEHVARVMDVGTLENGEPYLVMEYLIGKDLRQVLRARGPLPIEDVADYLVQVCDGMAEAHALGIVHRDLKPGNLFLTARPNGTPLIKVLDFGLAKVLDEAPKAANDASLTATGLVIGSPPYMPPEQLRSLKLADARSDIWSLGVIMFELLTGKQPFAADRTEGLIMAIAMDQPVLPRTLRPEIPEAMEALVLRCLRKDPRERVQTVHEIAAVMEPFAPGRRASFAALPSGAMGGTVTGPAAAVTIVMPAGATAAPAKVAAPVATVLPLTAKVAATLLAGVNTGAPNDATTLTLGSSELSGRQPAPRSQRDHRWLIACGLATVIATVVALAVGLRSSGSSQAAAGPEPVSEQGAASAVPAVAPATATSAVTLTSNALATAPVSVAAVSVVASGSSTAAPDEPPQGSPSNAHKPSPQAASPAKPPGIGLQASGVAAAKPKPSTAASTRPTPNPLKEWK